MSENTPITVAFGDGIGPEIMNATLLILKEAQARISVETIDIGKIQYEHGFTTGIAPEAWKTIKKNKILLKAPITTPQGGGYKSLNVTLRRALGLYANIRPCRSYHPFVETKHKEMNVIVVRENEEGLYTGIEHRHTEHAYESLKLLTRQGCERICRYAFELVQTHGRKKLTCFSKDNIMKMTDGLMHQSFDKVAQHYSSVENEHYIIDIGTAKLANQPELFDVVVTGNLYGDIISDIVAEISGSVGLAGSANIGDEYAMFEAVHGSAPDISDQGIANPSGLLNGAIMMLIHLGQNDVATTIHNAWLRTIEDGIHTADIYNESISKKRVGTDEFAAAVIERLGEKPQQFEAVDYTTTDNNDQQPSFSLTEAASQDSQKALVGVEVSLAWTGEDVDTLAAKINEATEATTLKLQLISSRGLKVWPKSEFDFTYTDYWQGRFIAEGENKAVLQKAITELLDALDDHKLRYTKAESLYTYDGQLGFSLAQGE
jgi:isocitrate dehydrogenase